MAKKTYKMVLAYPRIFDLTKYVTESGEEISYEDYKSGNYEGEITLDKDQRGKPGDLDRGDAKSTQKWLRELAKNPVAVVDAYFTSEADLEDFMSIEGFEDKVVNPQNGEESTRIKDGNEEFGIGKYIKLKRKFNDKVEFLDKKTGELKEVDKGGAPSVKILDGDTYVPYDYDTLGSPANGTVSNVRFEVFGKNAATRLEAFGILELLEYVEGEGREEEDF